MPSEKRDVVSTPKACCVNAYHTAKAGVGLLAVVLALMVGCSTGTPHQETAAKDSVPRRGQIFIVTEGRENVRLALVTVGLFREEEIQAHIAARRELAAEQMDSLNQLLGPARAALDAAKSSYGSYGQFVHRLIAKRDALLQKSLATPNESSAPVHEAWLRACDDVVAAPKLAAAEEQRIAGLAANVAALEEASGFYESGSYFVSNLPAPLATAQTDANGDFVIRVPKKGQYVVAALTERKIPGKTESYAWLVRLPAATEDGAPFLLSNTTLTTSGSELSLVTTPR